MVEYDLKPILCNSKEINTIHLKNNVIKFYPYIISEEIGNTKCLLASPIHGRSIIVDYNEDSKRYTVTKGNGLTYFPFGFISTEELDSHSWGYLKLEDAIRDYKSCEFIKKLGVKTNLMEAVYTLNYEELKFLNKIEKIAPNILQYTVECPFRIADIPFLRKETVFQYVSKWHEMFDSDYKKLHCIVADTLLKNIRLMHDNNVLHNAIHAQNYSLCLELLDFELTRTPLTPFESVEDESNYKKLQNREIIQSLEIVNQVCHFLNEEIDVKNLKKIMVKNGFENFNL